MDDIHIYEERVRLKKQRVPAALATVVETRGSTPRKAGAKMLVNKFCPCCSLLNVGVVIAASERVALLRKDKIS